MAKQKKAKDDEKAGSTGPNEPKLPSDGQNARSGGFTRSLAGDKSLEAYKNWVSGMVSNLNPNVKETVTEEQWVESWKKFWSKEPSQNGQAQDISAASASEPERASANSKATANGKATTNGKATAKSIEEVYPGVTQQIQQYKEAEWPACPHCGSSAHTAKVSRGIIGRAITMAASTSRIKLSAQPTPGNHYCTTCEEYFDYFEPTALMSPKP